MPIKGEMTTETTGERLRRWREARGLSQAELASLVGVAQPTIVKWETDQRQPRKGYWTTLEQALRLRRGTISQSIGDVHPDVRVAAVEAELAMIRQEITTMRAEFLAQLDRIVRRTS